MPGAAQRLLSQRRVLAASPASAAPGGGLGLRSAEAHAAAAYVASRAACSELCEQICPGHSAEAGSDAGVLHEAARLHDARVRPQDHIAFDPAEHRSQKELSEAVDDAVLADLEEHASILTRAHLSLVQAPGAAALFQAPPRKAAGLDVPHAAMQVAIQRRIRVQLFEREDFCPACGQIMDVWGDHALVCSCRGDRTKRHNALRNSCFSAAQAAGFPGAELERPGLLQPRPEDEGPPGGEAGGEDLDASGRRPADIWLPRWRSGAPAALDFAVTSGLRSGLIASSAASAASAAEHYEEVKRRHLDTARCCSEVGLAFVPMVVEAHGGGWGPEARRALATLAKRDAAASGEDSAILADQLAQRLAVSLHRENARALLRRFQPPASVAAEQLAAATAMSTADSV